VKSARAFSHRKFVQFRIIAETCEQRTHDEGGGAPGIITAGRAIVVARWTAPLIAKRSESKEANRYRRGA